MRGIVAIVFVVAFGGGLARAEDRAKARQLFHEAQQHYKLGEFQQALDGFKDAYRNFEDASLLFNIAQCERQLGQKQDALRSYRMFLSELPNAPNRAEVERTIATLEQAIKDETAAPPQGTMPPPQIAQPQPQPQVLQAAPPPPPKHTWWMIGAGAGLLAVGAAGIATGAAALAVDGHGTCTLAPGQVRCPNRYDTGTEGGVLVGVGAAAAIGGAVMIVLEERKYHAALHASVDVSPSGGALVFSGAF